MASFIWVQLKKTSEVDLAKPLVKFIQQTYPSGGEEQAQYCRAAEELSKLRRSALGRPLDKHEGALETLLRWARAAGLPPSLPSCPRSPPQPRFLLPS
jgi:programmed cell death 6-interacting protein